MHIFHFPGLPSCWYVLTIQSPVIAPPLISWLVVYILDKIQHNKERYSELNKLTWSPLKMHYKSWAFFIFKSWHLKKSPYFVKLCQSLTSFFSFLVTPCSIRVKNWSVLWPLKINTKLGTSWAEGGNTKSFACRLILWVFFTKNL